MKKLVMPPPGDNAQVYLVVLDLSKMYRYHPNTGSVPLDNPIPPIQGLPPQTHHGKLWQTSGVALANHDNRKLGIISRRCMKIMNGEVSMSVLPISPEISGSDP